MDEDEVEKEDEDEDEDEVEGEFVYLGVFGMRDSPRCAEKLCPPGGGQKTFRPVGTLFTVPTSCARAPLPLSRCRTGIKILKKKVSSKKIEKSQCLSRED